ncbi:MAG: B12-binding domain-containing radical SAM protein [Thermoproteota archaeon]|jgi:radical SAM superfamily enzyme YgiQ (UPF0313 family)|nr:MAG: B12-binding domain-containing radical SAM protein [Candidatus Korarchaeota archaeon]
MRVYLLNPPYYERFSRSMRWQETARGGTLYYPIWLAYATGVLEEEHKVKLVDAPADGLGIGDVICDATSFKPDVIVIETSFTSWRNDLNVAGALKNAIPEIFTVVVGPPTSVYYDRFLKSPAIDAVIRGEYDLVLRELVSTLEKGGRPESVSGVSLRKPDGTVEHNKDPPKRPMTTQEMDSLPFVSRVYKKHLCIKNYFLSSALYPEVQILSSRGCPFRCTFCEWPQVFTGRIYRLRSVENVIEEMVWIKENLPEVKEIVFEDDTFGLNRKWLEKFLDEIIQRGLDVTWSAQVRATLDYEIMSKMRKAGCRLLIVGFESGSNEILKRIKKGITVEQARKFARDAKKAGVLIHGDFIIGLPGETHETIKATWNLIKEIKPEILQISVATPFPGTEFYEWLKQNGYLKIEDPADYLDGHGHQKGVINYPDLPVEEIQRAVNRLLIKYYLSPVYLLLVYRQMLRKHGFEEVKRILRSAVAFMAYIRNQAAL